MVEETPEVVKRIGNRHQRRRGLILALHVLCIIANNYTDTLEDVQIVWLTAIRHQLLFHILVH